MPLSPSLRKLSAAAMLAVAVLGAGCAGKQQPNTGVAGQATPGSPQDFQVNVGDRVFFETDSSALTQQAVGTLTRQVQWLQQYPRYTLRHRRPRRRARHARIQPRTRRPPRHRRARLHDLARHRGEPHAHHLLRQGTPGGGVQRHLLLVAEPPRRDSALRRRLIEANAATGFPQGWVGPKSPSPIGDIR